MTLIERYGGIAWIAALAACALVSGDASVTFGAGEAGAGVMIVAIFTVSELAPVSITSASPAARPLVDARRIDVAPTAAAWLSVAAAATPAETLPAASSAR